MLEMLGALAQFVCKMILSCIYWLIVIVIYYTILLIWLVPNWLLGFFFEKRPSYLIVSESILNICNGVNTLDRWEFSIDLLPNDPNMSLVALGATLFSIFFFYVLSGNRLGCYSVLFGLIPMGLTLCSVDFPVGLYVTTWMLMNLFFLIRMMAAIARWARTPL